MHHTHGLRPIIWIGNSLKDLKGMPEEVKKEFGHSLREIQKGRDPGNTKSLKHLGVSGILEIVVDSREGTFRIAYSVEFKDCIVVLHAFQKKSKAGIATPKKEIDLILKRLQQSRIDHGAWKVKK